MVAKCYNSLGTNFIVSLYFLSPIFQSRSVSGFLPHLIIKFFFSFSDFSWLQNSQRAIICHLFWRRALHGPRTRFGVQGFLARSGSFARSNPNWKHGQQFLGNGESWTLWSLFRNSFWQVRIQFNQVWSILDRFNPVWLGILGIHFVIIQITCYRLIKGQQYLKKMYEKNYDD